MSFPVLNKKERVDVTEHYDYMTDEELLRYVYQVKDITPLENLLAKRLDRILALTAPTMGSQLATAEGRAECDTRG